MIYAAGSFVDPAALDVAAQGGADKVLAALTTKVTTIDQTKLSDTLRHQGARWMPVTAGDDAGPGAMRFPLGGPTRAAKASRKLVKELSL